MDRQLSTGLHTLTPMPTSLVTGAAGFIGSHVARRLLDNGHRVVALDDLSGGFLDNVPDGTRFVELDVTQHDAVAQLFDDEQFDYVFHLAAYAAEGLSHFIRRYNYTNNVLGSVTLINEAIKHDIERFIFASSIAVYGSNQVPMTEDMTPQPEDPYGIAKYTVELDLAAAHEMFGLPYTIFRPHNVYGPGQNIGDKYRNVIGIFMNQLMQGEPLTVFGDGRQIRAFSYIDDVAPIIASTPDVGGTEQRVFNVGADESYTVLRLANVVAHSFGVEPNIEHLPERNEVKYAFASHERLRSVFFPDEPIPLELGIGEMARWARAKGPRSTLPFAEEVQRNLPPSWRHRPELVD